MQKTVSINHPYSIVGILILLFTSLILITYSSVFSWDPKMISIGITADLIITIPLIYFLLIRKKEIPNITVIPIFILGLIIASYILPKENQVVLDLVKTWVLPIVELTIISIVILKVRKASRYYGKNKSENRDYFHSLQEACAQIVPKQVVVPFATEIAIFYYGFINWKSPEFKENQFTYHKDSPTRVILIALLFLIIIETAVFHLLLIRWSATAAWILTGISIYSGFQIFGLLRSITKRPISFEKNQLVLRYGVFGESRIDYANISSFEANSSDFELTKENRKLSVLGNMEAHNFIIRMIDKNTLSGFYGIRKSYKNIAFHVDNVKEFDKKLKEYLNQ